MLCEPPRRLGLVKPSAQRYDAVARAREPRGQGLGEKLLVESTLERHGFRPSITRWQAVMAQLREVTDLIEAQAAP